MREFNGFPSRTKYTPIPNSFFISILPYIEDITELKIILHIFWALYQKRGYPRFVTLDELVNDPLLMQGIEKNDLPVNKLRYGLDIAAERGILLHLERELSGEVHHIYFLNTEENRRVVDKIINEELNLGILSKNNLVKAPPEQSNIFLLYEQNIGMLSPIIAEELKEAEKIYPASWIDDAFKEAVHLNKRNWRYISRILERWATEGRSNGKPGRYSKAESDPEEYYRRYGHLLKK